MAEPRVDATEVKEIIETALSDATIEAFITAANLTVTNMLTDSGLDDDTLHEIERWLTAHLMACTRERQIHSEGAGEATVTYVGRTAMGLDATYYGQQVKVLDTTGILSSQLGKRNVTVFAVPQFEETTSGIDDV